MSPDILKDPFQISHHDDEVRGSRGGCDGNQGGDTSIAVHTYTYRLHLTFVGPCNVVVYFPSRVLSVDETSEPIVLYSVTTYFG